MNYIILGVAIILIILMMCSNKTEGLRNCVYHKKDRRSSVLSWGSAPGNWPLPGKFSSAECKKKCCEHPNCVQADTYSKGGPGWNGRKNVGTCYLYFDNAKQGGMRSRWTPGEDYYRCTGKKEGDECNVKPPPPPAPPAPPPPPPPPPRIDPTPKCPNGWDQVGVVGADIGGCGIDN